MSAARHDQHCEVCGLRNGDHRCLECNKRYPSIEELVAHQQKRQHFGGHHQDPAQYIHIMYYIMYMY